MPVSPSLAGKAIACLVVGATWGLAIGCEKKAPPDLMVAEGYQRLGADPTAALAAFARARNPNDPSVLLGQGLAHEGLREYGKAEQFLERARQLNDRPVTWLPLARVRVMLGKLEQARAGTDAVLAAAPSDLGGLLLATCLANDTARAKAVLSRLDRWPKSGGADASVPNVTAEYHLARAALHAQLGDPDRANRARKRAGRAALGSESVALSLSAVAYYAERQDFALLLLERLIRESRNVAILRHAVTLSHALGAHPLTGKALQLLPDRGRNDTELLRLRAEHQFLTRQPQAVETLRRAVAATKDPATLARLELFLVKSLIHGSDRSAAKAELEKLLEAQPQHLAAQLAMARMELEEGSARAAIDRLEPLATEGAIVAVHEILAWASLEAREPVRARRHLEAIIARNSSHQRAWLALSLLDSRASMPETAVRRLEQLVRKEPQVASHHLLLARIVRETQSPRVAESVLSRGIEAVPHEPHLWVELAQAQRRRRARSEALATLQEGARKNPLAPTLYAALNSLHTELGQTVEAARFYDLVLQHAGGNVVALNNTAMLYADELGNAEQAVDLAERAHELAPTQAAITDTLAWALYRRNEAGDLGQARTLLESIQADEGEPTWTYHLAMVLRAAGEERASTQLLRQALAEPGDFPEAETARQALGKSPASDPRVQ